MQISFKCDGSFPNWQPNFDVINQRQFTSLDFIGFGCHFILPTGVLLLLLLRKKFLIRKKKEKTGSTT